jgi:uncharacterized membrane protein YGL010W
MRDADRWLEEYSRSRQATGGVLPWLSIPAIVISLVGLLWSIPVPEPFRQASPALNWGTVFLMASVVYYFIMSIRLAFGSLPFVIFSVGAVAWADELSAPLWLTSATLFFVAWSLQVIGQWRQGKRPHLFRDLQLLMIGPLWLLSRVYRRLNIRY